MKTWVRRSLNAGALTAGALLATGAAAQASPVMTSADNVGLLNGTQANVPVNLNVDACGNAVAVGGWASTVCERGASALDPEWTFESYQTSTGNHGILNGTQANVPVNLNVDVCGTAVAVLGAAATGCYEDPNGYTPPREDPDDPGYENPLPPEPYGWDWAPELGGAPDSADALASTVAGTTEDATMLTGGNHGILNGTQLNVPVVADVDVCGTALAVLGVAKTSC